MKKSQNNIMNYTTILPTHRVHCENPSETIVKWSKDLMDKSIKICSVHKSEEDFSNFFIDLQSNGFGAISEIHIDKENRTIKIFC
jgi:hypothetical protein